jgi:hypothetical protein
VGGLPACETGAYGNAIAKCLGKRNDIGLYRLGLESKHVAGSAYSSLHLVEH